ncbi:ComEC/Rec2 family competence protein [Variovorax sp. J22R115]|uniref:ComEC/Rec2 family competence protein n=1 Tax=Variovorax sp. J22R115 TaxID=3053509 RepID=UPI002575722F|nr:ComEC/Rec2 family competence protein [Variovorax sp. J22R115]MDM0053737.1 ComEC/Rec2 family competence protein [Variovorax sp. J22R115]
MPGAKARGLVGFASMAGSVLGAALQLQQPALWNWAAYAGLLAGALGGWLALHSSRRPVRGVLPMALLFGAMFGVGMAGWRATAYADGALPPTLEGRELQVIGVVAQMPQRGEGMVRFELEVESAEPPDVPRRISLGWYAEGSGPWGQTGAVDPPGRVHAGERWRMTVRLRAPHGNLNPHGFDQELRLWEQGVHATGQVRTGARDPRPERIAATWRHPVERLRETVRDAVFERVADPRSAGVIAALVTGDQNAIDLGRFFYS